jgi:hypothetical protein
MFVFLYFHLERRADENNKGDKVHWRIAAKCTEFGRII